ncbi:12353_t:CDS:2 [Acaulospora morrowiae]|uniref:12353_t:CDS:1 n=1 Tax=Acaulospora morrowiae TaxID=94023 RepID=A0A9N9B0A3_9GLOM|nr:12353_t:CDS:2 [Acaulospora morrowiae]
MSEFDLEEGRVPEKYQNSSDDGEIQSHVGNETSVDYENFPHNGKSIYAFCCSPKMEYVLTMSIEDRSVYTWKVIKKEEEVELKLDKPFNLKDLQLMIPICVSDFENVIITHLDKNSHISEIRDYQNKSMKILKAQKYFKGMTICTGFLKNGDYFIVKGDPLYQEKLLILLDVPFVVMQWNLNEREFETQYELDWNLAKFKHFIHMELDNDCAFLAVFGVLQETISKVYFYSTEAGTMIKDHDATSQQHGVYQQNDTSQLNQQNDTPQLNQQNGTSQMNQQSGISQLNQQNGTSQQNDTPQLNQQNDTSQLNQQNGPSQINQQSGTSQLNQQNGISQLNDTSYVINLRTFLRSDSVKLNISSGIDFIIPGYIVRFRKDLFHEDRLQIESLSQSGMDDLHNKFVKDNKFNLYSSTKEEIKETIENILEKYNSKQDFETKNDQDSKTESPFETLEYKLFIDQHSRTREHRGQLYTWTVEGVPDGTSPLEGGIAVLTVKQTETKKEIGNVYYEISLEELATYVNKVENKPHEEASRPNVPFAIKQIIGYEQNLDEKINNLSGMIYNQFGMINNQFGMINNKFDALYQQFGMINVLGGMINELDKKVERINEFEKRFDEIIKPTKQEKKGEDENK